MSLLKVDISKSCLMILCKLKHVLHLFGNNFMFFLHSFLQDVVVASQEKDNILRLNKKVTVNLVF